MATKQQTKGVLVANLVRRTRKQFSGYNELLSSTEAILSFNKVTGHSVNFPIAGTCQPTSVCAKRCYYAKAGSSWPASLKKQLRLYNNVKADPIGTGGGGLAYHITAEAIHLGWLPECDDLLHLLFTQQNEHQSYK